MAVYPHMPMDASPLHWGRARCLWRGLTTIGNTCCRAPIRPFFASSGGAKFPKMGDALPRAPTNHRAKFDAASSILAGEIRNRTKL